MIETIETIEKIDQIITLKLETIEEIIILNWLENEDDAVESNISSTLLYSPNLMFACEKKV